MRTHFVVVLPPRFDDHLCLGARTKSFEAQALVAKLTVEAFRDAILCQGLFSTGKCNMAADQSRSGIAAKA
jgi:hypothetical protein